MPRDNNYAANVVAAKLFGLVGSPVEMVMGNALFAHFSNFYKDWWCRIYSASEFSTIGDAGAENGGSLIAIIPQFQLPNIGRVDFGLFIARLSVARPLVVVECDGHDFHDRTPQQASSDRKRDRASVALGIPTLRFTGADILRDSAAGAAEVADVFDKAADAAEQHWWRTVGDELNKTAKGGMYVPYQWPRMRVDGRTGK